MEKGSEKPERRKCINKQITRINLLTHKNYPTATLKEKYKNDGLVYSIILSFDESISQGRE